MKSADTGFVKDLIVNFPLKGGVKGKREVLRDELMKDPDIKGVAFSNSNPGSIKWTDTFTANGTVCSGRFNSIDTSYLQIVGLKLI